ncbi:hypothetical protein AWB70_05972 [Caballeronia cordobensis]|uniref:Uncharacterized protein n=1 Tax=Caballeronia cordobensis TaxID=1353886 RepID=A0A158J638_CABCO|nr:hypothetical protein AWB70_05972 [Caballeronia cordobensis]
MNRGVRVARRDCIADARKLVMRSISQSSIFFGNARCDGSRLCDGDTAGSQSPWSQRGRRPRCVNWIITFAPCAWHSSTRSFIHGTTSSLYARMLLRLGRLRGNISRFITEDMAVRMMRIPDYVEVFTGVRPKKA